MQCVHEQEGLAQLDLIVVIIKFFIMLTSSIINISSLERLPLSPFLISKSKPTE